MEITPSIKFIAQRLLRGKVTIFTGAGMSTASGLPDFRSVQNGLWGKIDPMAVANVKCLRSNYSQFRDFYKMRIDCLNGVEPNQGHFFISELEKQEKLTGLITQNVDGLHELAESVNMAALHGHLREIFCENCRTPSTIEAFMNNQSCSLCKGPLRPGIVLFGENLPRDQMKLADDFTYQCETFMVLGSSLQVSPANLYPERAKHNKAKLIIINNDPTPLDKLADVVLHEPIVDVLEQVKAAMKTV